MKIGVNFNVLFSKISSINNNLKLFGIICENSKLIQVFFVLINDDGETNFLPAGIEFLGYASSSFNACSCSNNTSLLNLFVDVTNQKVVNIHNNHHEIVDTSTSHETDFLPSIETCFVFDTNPASSCFLVLTTSESEKCINNNNSVEFVEIPKPNNNESKSKFYSIIHTGNGMPSSSLAAVPPVDLLKRIRRVFFCRCACSECESLKAIWKKYIQESLEAVKNGKIVNCVDWIEFEFDEKEKILWIRGNNNRKHIEENKKKIIVDGGDNNNKKKDETKNAWPIFWIVLIATVSLILGYFHLF